MSACLSILMIVFGVFALVKGEFKILANRKVRGSTSRALGILLLIGAAAALIPDYGGTI